MNFSLNGFQKKISKKKNLQVTELKFIEETYIKHKPIHDEIIAVNILVFLARCNACKIDKDKIIHNEDVVFRIIKQLEGNQNADQNWTKLDETPIQLDHFIGAYSLITEIKRDISQINKLISRELVPCEQRLSLVENAHKQQQVVRPV